LDVDRCAGCHSALCLQRGALVRTTFLPPAGCMLLAQKELYQLGKLALCTDKVCSIV